MSSIPSISDKSVLYFNLRSEKLSDAAGMSRFGTGRGKSLLPTS